MPDSLFVELYAALHDTLPDEPAQAPTTTPNRTPTAMPGLSVKEPDQSRGWKLAEGHTFDENVVAKMRSRAQAKGYILDVRPMRFMDGTTRHHLTVYHPKGKKMENPTEFYSADQGQQASTPKLPDLHAEATGRPLHEFLDHRVTELLPAHMETGQEPAEENQVHTYFDLKTVDPSEHHNWQDLAAHPLRTDRDNISGMVKTLQGGGQLPPVLMRGTPDDKQYRPTVIDGHHRMVAHLQHGSARVPAVYDHETLMEIWARANGMRPNKRLLKTLAREYDQHIRQRAASQPPDQYTAAFHGAFVDRYARLKSQAGQRRLFEEAQHPRGQPENAGEFATKGQEAPAPDPDTTGQNPDTPPRQNLGTSQQVPTNPDIGTPGDAPASKPDPLGAVQRSLDQQGIELSAGPHPEDPEALSLGHLIVRDPRRQRQGHGTAAFRQVVDAARQMGLKRIHLEAARDDDPENSMAGYYAFARLGADGPLPRHLARDAKAAGFNATRVSQLIATPEGRAWWRENGDTMDMTFNLSPDSPSMKALAGYGQTKPAPTPGTTVPSAGGRPTGETLTGPGGGDAAPKFTGLAPTHQGGGRYLQHGTRVQFLEGEHAGRSATITNVIQSRYRKEPVTYRIQLDGLKGGLGETTVTADQLMRQASQEQPQRHTALASALLREYYAARFADQVVERYAEQQSRLFDDAGGSPRKEFDETKHQRAGGQFARKFPKVQSKEVQPALPGVDLPPQQAIVTRKRAVGQAPTTVTTDPQTPGIGVTGPHSNTPDVTVQPRGALSASLPPPSNSILPPHHRARHAELLAKGFRRTPAEQQELQDLGRRIEELQDARPVTREHYTETPPHWTHDPNPPVDESAYTDADEHHKKLWEFYQGKGASSRTTPAELPNPPVGSWRMDKHFGIYGREIEQLRMMPVHELTLSEPDYTDPKINDEGRGDDARRYAGWMKEHGLEHLPPIHVVETDQGTHRVMNGHRRTAAAKLAGLTHIPAWVSPRMKTGKKYYGQDLDIGTGLTYEGAHHGAEAASKMYEDRQRKLSESVRADREAKSQQPAESYRQRIHNALLDRYTQPRVGHGISPQGGLDPESIQQEYSRTFGEPVTVKPERDGIEFTTQSGIKAERAYDKMRKAVVLRYSFVPEHLRGQGLRSKMASADARLFGGHKAVLVGLTPQTAHVAKKHGLIAEPGSSRHEGVMRPEYEPQGQQPDPYAKFQELASLAAELERYKVKDSPGQQHLFGKHDVSDEPRDAGGQWTAGASHDEPDARSAETPRYPMTPAGSLLDSQELAAHREALTRALDRPRDEMQRQRDERARRKAANQAMLSPKPTPTAGPNEDLVSRLQAGDQQAFNELLARNKPFILDRARRAGAREQELDDYLQEGSIVLWKAAQDFRPEHGNGFLAYAGVAIDRRFWKLKARAVGTKDNPKPKMLQGAQDEEGRAIHEPVDQSQNPVDQRDLQQAVRRVLEKLPNPRHRQVLQLAYGLDGPRLTQREIAAQMKVRPQAVQQLLGRILPELKRALKDQYAARCLREAVLERYHQRTGSSPERYAQAMRAAYLDRYGWRDAAGGLLSKAVDWVKGTPPSEHSEPTDHRRGNPPTAPTKTEQRSGPPPQTTEPPITAQVVQPKAPPKIRTRPLSKAEQEMQAKAQQGARVHPVLSYTTPALFDIRATTLHTPNLQAAHQALTRLHDPEQIQQEAHRIVDAKVRAQTVNIRNDQSQYRKLYQQHIDPARQAVHEKLKQQADQSLAAAQREVAEKQALIRQATEDTRDFHARAQQYPEGHPDRAKIMDAVRQYVGHIKRHRDQLGELQRTVAELHQRAPAEPEPWQGWSSGEGKKPLSDEERKAREDERHEVSRARRNLDWLARRVELPKGQTGNPARDVEHPEYRQQIMGLLDQELAKHRAGQGKTKSPAAKQPESAQPADSATWLAHAQEAVHQATSPAQVQAKVDSLARTAWKKQYPNVPPRGNPAYGRFVAQARVDAQQQLNQQAAQRLDAAEAWHQQQGQPAPGELQGLRKKLTAQPAARGPTGHEDAVPMVVGPGGEKKAVTEQSLARQEAKQKPDTPAPAIRPEERAKTKAQQASEYNKAWAAEYGMTPATYHQEASRFWQDRVERAQSLEGLRQDLARGGLTGRKTAQLENAGFDEDSVKNLDTATDMAAARGLADMTPDQLFALAKRGPIEIPGPHQDEWHNEFVDSLRAKGHLPHSERQQASQEPDEATEPDHGFTPDEMHEMQREAFETGTPIEDLMTQRREQLADSTPFSAARAPDLRSELYSALWWAGVKA